MIRCARAQDVPAIVKLIHELAHYEREPDAVAVTEDGLRDSLFGENPAVFALVAQEALDVVGTAVWFLNYSTWTGTHGIYLEDLVVGAAHRGSGHGRALMAELARLCVERGYARLEWSVLNWNESALHFYRSLGAEAMSGWTVHRLAGDNLKALGTTTDA